MPRDGDLPVRDKELATRRRSKIHGDLIEVFSKRVRQGFYDQGKRSDDIKDYWDIYDCVLNNRNFYNGNSNIYVPIVYSAIEAIVTRFVNQIFPQSGRYIDATATDGQVPHAMVALLEHYIRRAKLKTEVLPALIRCGEVEGHYHVFVDWNRYERHVTSRELVKPKIPTGIGQAEGEEGVPDIIETTLIDEGPGLQVLHDADVVVQPVTACSIDDALHQGGQVTIVRKWTKETVERLIEDGEIMPGPGKDLLEMSKKLRNGDWKDPEKNILDAAGIKEDSKIFQVYEMYKVLDTDEGARLCSCLYGGYDLILSAKRIKYWNDRCPLLSVPVNKVAGSFKGSPKMAKGIDSLQYHANQVAQQAADSMTYGMLPVFMTDPAKNPRTPTMILNLAAIWEVDPNSTKTVEFPKLWQDGIGMIQADMQMIFQAWGVNPAMLPQQTGRPGAKRNQAEVAMEIQVDLLTTAVGVGVLEEGIMTPFAEHSVDLDHQFRDQDATVRAFGDFGSVVKMEDVPPQQTRTRLNFTWFGVEQARNAAQMQQQIAWLNVARGMEAQLAKAGYILDPAPPLIASAGNIFGWRMGRQVLRDMRQQMSMDAEYENQMLMTGLPAYVHLMDDDAEHIRTHAPLLQMLEKGTPEYANTWQHIQFHQMQMGQKNQAMMQQRAMQGQPGMGGPPGGGSPGPQPGAQPAGPKLVRGPAGAIPPDQMPRAGAVGMPRKM